MKKTNKKITIEYLASMCQTEFTAIHGKFDVLHGELKEIRTNIREIKLTINPFVHAVAEMKEDFEQLQNRVTLLEERLALAQ